MMTLYRIRYRLPYLIIENEIIFKMDDEQQKFYDLVTAWVHRYFRLRMTKSATL